MAFTWSSISAMARLTLVGEDTGEGTSLKLAVVKPTGYAPYDYTIGTGAASANKCHAGLITLAGSATTIDLTNMSFGQGDSSIAKVKGWLIRNETTTSGYKVTVGNAASAQFTFKQTSATDTFEVAEGGVKMYHDGTTNGTTTTSANNVKFDPGANTVSVFFAVWGE
jgi:hypothetical protein